MTTAMYLYRNDESKMHWLGKGIVMILAALLWMMSAAAETQVLVVPRVEDAYLAGDVITADTQLVLLTECKTKKQEELNAYLHQVGAPQVMIGAYDIMKSYSAQNLKRWNKETHAYLQLVAQLRVLQPTMIHWFVSEQETDLHAYMGELLLNAARDLPDLTIRGDDRYDQYGCTVTTLIDEGNGTAVTVQDKGWMEAIREKWGDSIMPEIPSLPVLNENGFLNAGENCFVYSDRQSGVWVYISDELKVTITRHTKTNGGRRVWFEADVIRAESSAQDLHCFTPAGKTKGYKSEKLADGWVFAVNADYHQGRNKAGLIFRGGELKYENKKGKANGRGIPNLDCMLLNGKGQMSVWPATTLSPEKAISLGAVDVLSFGPLLIRDGVWRQVQYQYHGKRDPRTAVGLIEDNHYLVIFAEGRLEESPGMKLGDLQEIFLLRGAKQAFNLDGGGTSCMYFMGERIGGGGNLSGKGNSQRSQYEMLVIGDMKAE